MQQNRFQASRLRADLPQALSCLPGFYHRVPPPPPPLSPPTLRGVGPDLSTATQTYHPTESEDRGFPRSLNRCASLNRKLERAPTLLGSGTEEALMKMWYQRVIGAKEEKGKK